MTPDGNAYFREGEQAGARYALGPPRRAPRGVVGTVRGGRRGSSLEFQEHRAYQPGDDLRHLDWNAYARSDQLAVKVYHEEVTPRLDVVVDGSRSMALEGSAKERATLALAALLATAAANAGYAHAAWVAADGCRAVANGRGRPSTWGPVALDFPGSPAESFARRPPSWPPRGLRVLLSDLLWEGDPLRLLAPFAERATAVVVVQVLAGADVGPPGPGSLRLEDVETGRAREVWLDAAARRQYRDALARHQDNWSRACRQAGAVLTTVVAEEVVRDWRLDDLVAAEVLQVAPGRPSRARSKAE